MRSLFALFRNVSDGSTGSATDAAGILREADAARRNGDWTTAAALYRHHSRMRPRRLGSLIQLGNMLKQLGKLADAETAYRAAIAIRPTVEAWTQLGHLHMLGGRADQAVWAFESALAVTPDSASARQGLISAGARDRLPPSLAVDAESLNRLSSLIPRLGAALARLSDAAITPIALYDAFRRANACPPAPGASSQAVAVVIDARGAAPDRLHGSLLGLIGQTHEAWTALVLADETIRAHPVCSLASAEPRVRILEHHETVDSLTISHVLPLPVGVILEASALGWLVYGLETLDIDVVYSDHDHRRDVWPEGMRYEDPAFQPAPDPDDLASTPELPVIVLWRRQAGAFAGSWPPMALDRVRLTAASLSEKAAHIPLVLGSVKRLAPAASAGLPSPAEMGETYHEIVMPAVVSLAGKPASDELLHVVIPTRNEAKLLATCIDSLIGLAARPDLLKITVVDNRSDDEETIALLRGNAAQRRFEVLRVDEPFNWSRINNLAAERGRDGSLLFLNNDTQMLTPGWDVLLSAQLARPEVGIVGARLLYPDQTVQHAGVVMGMGGGTPRHEGVGAPKEEGGPLERWRRPRSVAAVTGAFLGTRRETFKRLNGFDEIRWPIGYSDIDLCLKCRRQGLSVRYDAGIELIHHESRSRGLNDTRGRLAWDCGELASMVAAWRDALSYDPAVNPHWVTVSSRPFDGIRTVSREEAENWMKKSVRRDGAFR